MNTILSLTLATVATLSANGPHSRSAERPTILLVHGAFADASGWGPVITLLERDGYSVATVQNPLTGLADDVANTKRAIDSIGTPVVVVGHSYGGVVITGAAAGESNVKSLVYVAAFAPEAGEKLGELSVKFGAPAIATALVPDKGGYLTIDRAKFHRVFCMDVPAPLAHVMAVTQKPVNSVVFGDALKEAAWKTIPSWFIVAKNDQAIRPELERFMAQRAMAHTTEVESSHVVFLSHPEAVVKVIEEAAQ